MVTRNLVVSDLSGAPDAETVTLGMNAQWYAVDLTEPERAELDDLLQPYLSVSREAKPPPNPKRFVPTTTREERIAVREWARLQGFELAGRRVIPRRVRLAYQRAHPAEEAPA